MFHENLETEDPDLHMEGEGFCATIHINMPQFTKPHLQQRFAISSCPEFVLKNERTVYLLENGKVEGCSAQFHHWAPREDKNHNCFQQLAFIH